MTHQRLRPILKGIMLGTFSFLLLLFLLAVFLKQPILSSARKVASAQVSPTNLRAHVEFLSGLTPARSYPNVESLNRAADYIHQHFLESGGTVSEQRVEIDGQFFRNVIADFGPDTPEMIIVGAHYDSFGGFPGADDNASGTAGALELARILGKTKPPIRVELVAYTLEEPPFFRTADMGSMVHATSLKERGKKVRAMLCLEMIGYFSDQPNSQEYPIAAMKLIYPTRADFISVVGRTQSVSLVRKVKSAMIRAQSVPVRSINAPAFISGVDFSDHSSYWHQGYDAVMISDTSFYRNDRYHTSRDTADTLDYAKMAQVVDGVYAAVMELSK